MSQANESIENRWFPSWLSHVNKTNFHMKGFALGLILKHRQKATRKLPIDLFSFCLFLVSSNPLTCKALLAKIIMHHGVVTHERYWMSHFPSLSVFRFVAAEVKISLLWTNWMDKLSSHLRTMALPLMRKRCLLTGSHSLLTQMISQMRWNMLLTKNGNIISYYSYYKN